MPQININYLAVLVAAIANMVLGFLWYSPFVLGKKWMELMAKSGKDIDMKKGAMKAYAVSFLTALLMAYVLAYTLGYAGAASGFVGVTIGFWMWIGFVATTSLSTVLFEGRSFGLYLISAMYYLVSLLMMGAILGAWH